MISCPSCNFKELSGALFCSNCGAQLVRINDERDTSSIKVAIIDELRGSTPPFPQPPDEAPDSTVALRILNDGDVLHIGGTNEYTLGRSTQGQTIIPDIDLSSYQAYEAGVSRLHATLNITSSGVTIKDLDSANGTRLNGIHIEPYEEQRLNHGDILTFGRLKIQVLIKE